MTTSNQSTTETKTKSLIRWEAVIPFFVICLLIGLYFNIFFDGHIRRTLEWVGYNAIGSEVNITKLETSFFNARLNIQDIELTDSERPTHNTIKIGEIRFSMLWDALLRGKIVINEAAVEKIEFGSIRKYPGKVKPPEPVSKEPGFTEKLKKQALEEAQKQAGENILGDVIAMLSGADADSQIEQLKKSLPSKQLLEQFEINLKSKQKEWDQRLKSLPQEKDLKAINERLYKIKYKDFKTPQELQTTLQDLDKIFKDGDTMFKQVQGTADGLNKNLKEIESQYKDIEKQIKIDIVNLEKHFRIPKLDPKELSTALFNHYLSPYKNKFYRYKAMADKYLPPNLLKKDAKEEVTLIQPHPREKGISYEFGRPNSYPLFWIKNTIVSSKTGSSPDSGNIEGKILDITSNQTIIGKPTLVKISGDFPSKEIFGMLIQLSLDNTQHQSEIDYTFKVASYPIEGLDLVKSNDVQIGFKKSIASASIDGKITGLKAVSLRAINTLSKIEYIVTAKNQIASEILTSVFTSIPTVNLTIEGQGDLPNVPLSINSNLGPELQKGFAQQIQNKIAEAKKKIQVVVDEQIGQQKQRIDQQIAEIKNKIEKELQKAQNQLTEQKKQAESKAEKAKKDAENQGRKQLEKEGKKALDDLKKKLGF